MRGRMIPLLSAPASSRALVPVPPAAGPCVAGGMRARLRAACPLPKRKGQNNGQWQKRMTKKQKRDLAAWRTAHRWHPQQLRHTHPSRVRKELALEAAHIVLAHAKADVTQLYAKRDMNRAAAVAARIG